MRFRGLFACQMSIKADEIDGKSSEEMLQARFAKPKYQVRRSPIDGNVGEH